MQTPAPKIRFFRSIHGKLLLNYLPLSLIPLIAVSFLAYSQARDALQRAAVEKLEAVRTIKKSQIEDYLAEREAAARATVDMVNVLRQEAFDRLEALRDAKHDAITHLFQDWQTDLLAMSSNSDLIARAVQLSAGFEELGADQVRQLYLGRPDLEEAGSQNNYSQAHTLLHRSLASHIQIYEYEDALLVDDRGSIIYTVKKGLNFGLDLAADPGSSLGTLFQQLKAAKSGQSAFTDVSLIDGKVTMFIGSPVYDGATFVGVLIYQLPFEQIDQAVQVPEDMQQTAEVYLVGSDNRMRSTSTLDPENRSVVASLAGTVEQNGVTTISSQAALSGTSGVDILLNYRGAHSVSAYAPLSVPGLNWVIIAEEDVTEAIVPRVEGSGMYILTQYALRYGYQDLLLMTRDGYVFHTVMRGPDYQTNLLTGPYQTTHLGRLVQEVLRTGELAFADFAPYLPAGNKPVAFVAAPIMDQDKPDMVLALQLPPGWTDEVMQERTGMGTTGETILVGSDKRMRSNSYLDPAAHSVEASFVGTVEKNGMDNDAVRQALAGNTGIEEGSSIDYLGNQVILAYAPVQFGDLNWALIAKQNVDEAFILVDRLNLAFIMINTLAAITVVIVTLWTARRLSQPILKLAGAANSFAAGKLDISVPVDNIPGDELAILENTFMGMATQLRDLINSLEEKVEKRTVELEAANKELEAFTYSVSHDLRAPLRAINGYSQILAEDYGTHLDDEGKRVIAVISNQAQRMGQLIDELLAFSRLGRAQMQNIIIDMTPMVQAAFDDLMMHEDRERIEFHLSPLPLAVGDPFMIKQAWTNLVSNAIKFTSKRERAIIEVGSQEKNDEVIYYIRDNGAGFDMRYIDKLFGVFQRLHTEKDFGGTGVGLAIVRRVIQRHGGRVWAESQPGVGATFYFTTSKKGTL